MVSTRGVKARFSEGERVLCYEPDPTKAKVLYESKVLQIVHNKDGRGRKQLEYLIHFQGWNASWDRCVDEDLVLRDTEENRHLQKRLMENAQIKLKEKKKKRRLSDTIREIVLEREKQHKSGSEADSQTTDDDDRSSLTSDADSTATTSTTATGSRGGSRRYIGGVGEVISDACVGPSSAVPETPSLMGVSGGGGGGALSPCLPVLSGDEVYMREFPIDIPVALKAVLERDQYLIKEQNKVVRLPCPPAALSVLESYVVFFATRYLARTSERRRNETKLKDKAYLTLDLCKEVMDGVRVCFDFHCSSHLLYCEERQQAAALATAVPPKLPIGQHFNGHEFFSTENGNEDDKQRTSEDKLKSSYSSEEGGVRRLTRSGGRPSALDEGAPAAAAAAASTSESGRSTPVTASSVSSSSQQTAPPPPQPSQQAAAPAAQHQQASSVQQHPAAATPESSSGGGGGGGGHNNLLSSLGPLSHDLSHWTLLPLSHRTPGTATLVYGPMHLLRLFVKLPEILYRMNLPLEKKRIILKHIQLFLEYLDVHNQDLFSDSHYVPNGFS